MKINMNMKKIANGKTNKKLFLGVGIFLVLVACLGWSLSNQGTQAETAKAERGEIKKYVEEIGEVKCEDSTTVYLEGNGLIKSIDAEENQQVKKGDLLLTMDSDQLEISLKDANESLNEARARYETGEESYQTALKDYENTKYLAGEGAVSQWELTQKEAAMKSAEAAREGYKAAVDQAALNVQNSSLSLGRQQVLSPIDGTVLEKNVEVNAYGVPGTAAFVIGNSGNIKIESKILADDIDGVKIGSKAEITARTDEKQAIEGTVVKIAPTAVDETSSLGVKQKKVAVTIRPVDSQVSLKLGSEVDVKVVTEAKSSAVIVPAGAVFDYQGASCVFVVKRGKAVLRKVETGIRNESYAEIKKGLEEGEPVISAPDNSIEEGMRIKSGS
ncbi:MAG TPA: efflux RND transporter periplasmic adaptor subunit [Bacillota bacterium]|nr:efflux RND transporter periplasmic adaptor subunit [Bacillota bacterium]